MIVSGYNDVFFTKDHTREGCYNNVMRTAKLFHKLRFVVHPDKSAIMPK